VAIDHEVTVEVASCGPAVRPILHVMPSALCGDLLKRLLVSRHGAMVRQIH
jgi:hypothetical protein